MNPGTVVRTLHLCVLVVAGVGVLDAGIGRQWDLVVLFALIGALAVALLTRGLGRRRGIEVRADLAEALVARSRSTGEPLDQLTDRALATYFGALAGGDEHPPR